MCGFVKRVEQRKNRGIAICVAVAVVLWLSWWFVEAAEAAEPFGVVGAVLPFNLAACPAGWTAFSGAAGRVVVGVGTLGANTYALGANGGSASHTLTIAEMPAHTHAFGLSASSGTQLYPGGAAGTTASGTITTGGTGGGTAVDTRPPYTALLMCERTSEVVEGESGSSSNFTLALLVGAVGAFGLGFLAGK